MADKYNVEEAEALAKRALHLPIAQATPIYEQLLSLYPTSARYWKQYVEAHMAVNNDDATKQIFSRCLLTCLQVPLWQCYIRFIRKVYDKKGAEGQEETTKAFEFMLNYIGTDIASGPIWTDYITFLKSLPALNLNEDLHRKNALRKVYHRAILTPTHHVEQLWKDYENFENSVNRQLAKGLVNEYQPKFNSARAVYRERKKYIEEIDWNMLAVPPTGSSKEETQWVAWKKFLSFEKGNPQRIDTASSTKRIIYAYEQCLMCLYHYPDVWYDYAEWHVKSGTTDAAIKVFQRALKAIPDSEMLKYAYAEMEESRGAIQSAKKLYESILGVSTNSLAHIQFLRFLRRAEGVEAARKYFLDARKSPSCTYHVYIAFATMAFCIDKEPKVAHNIFEEGLKLYMSEPVYILEYADFLTRLNDDRNIRALFERALSTLPAEDSAEVWNRFIQFEQTYGDLASILKVEQRMKEALSGKGEEGSSPLESSLQDVVSRYSYMDLWPCTSNDLDHLARQELLVKNLNKKVGKTNLPHGPAAIGSVASSSKVVYPDTSQMVVQDPTKKSEFASSANPVAASASNTFPGIVTATATHGSASTFDEIPKTTPPALLAFLANLPIVDE
ncbi:cleavage stimulation factor subunit 77 isoform X2 [Arabidopsis lyrata subsp. lyrata]|uniref:cleavage stimulation factor subunit 77 isoform X2 n=1 Tax=Arabidopsis lyrata subsp. lyrata TaxID=81972 RepID=UPI000A29A680|nr:cleavage stimulation factor subunit 77 isoform X2 [Arabidopsis lyrata subsp. lyrata]|eukprot:XP_020867680.1 cleavage stimulation factor subunit 77 isoform X2 [Arabidopsis lyrata subsp. lyrata]